MTAFGKLAPLYWDANLRPIPTEPNSKRPAKEIKGWQGYAGGLPNADKRREWCIRYADRGLGLVLGTEIAPGVIIAAIDVDDDQLG